MALPPELQQELQQLSDLPLASALEGEMKSHARLAEAKANGDVGGISPVFNSVMIASEKLGDAERLARGYAKSLVVNKLVQEDKIRTLDWKTIFNNAAGKPDAHIAIGDNLGEAFKNAEGGVLIISEPYQCPPDMSARDFAFANYTATALLMEKLDEVDESFGTTVDELLNKGKDLNEIERQFYNKDIENPRKPVVIMIGRPFEMESMLAEDPYPWDTRFIHRMGFSEHAGPPKPRKPPTP